MLRIKNYFYNYKKLSLRDITFAALMFLQVLILIPVMVLGYNHLAAKIDENFCLLNKQSESDLKALIHLYDNIRNFNLMKVPGDHTRAVFDYFAQAVETCEGNITGLDLGTLKKKYGTEFFIVDGNSLKVINSSDPSKTGIDLSCWGHMISFLNSLPENEIKYRYSWSNSNSRLVLFSYLKLPGGRYILETTIPGKANVDFNSIIRYILDSRHHHKYVIDLHLYDRLGYRVHSDRYVPTEEIRSLVSGHQILNKSSVTVHDETGNVMKKYLYLPEQKHYISDRNVYLAEIHYDVKKIEDEKKNIGLILCAVFLAELIFAYFFSRFLAKRVTVPVARLVRQTEALAKGSLGEKLDPMDGQKEFQMLTRSISKLATDLKSSLVQERDLAKKMINLQEIERRSFARDLHDSVGQCLIAAKLKLSIQSSCDVKKDREEAVHILDFASKELREIYISLYPSVILEMGLEGAVNWYARVFFREEIEAEINIHLSRRLKADSSVHVFRIVQESFANIRKHSEASFCSVDIWHDQTFLFLNIGDNGKGLACEYVIESGQGFGQKSIALRVDEMKGSLKFQASSLGGLEVRICIPLGEIS